MQTKFPNGFFKKARSRNPKSKIQNRKSKIALLLALLSCPCAFAASSDGTSVSLDTIVRESIVASYLENPRPIEQRVQALRAFDRRRQAAGAPGTGCTDNLAWLWAESLPTPEARAAGHGRIRGGVTDPGVATDLQAAQAGQLAAQVAATRKQDRWGRWGAVVTAIGENLSRLSNGQLYAVPKLFGALVFAPAEFRKVTERERKEWWLMDTYLRQRPAGAHAAAYGRRKLEIEQRLREDAMRRCMEMARFYAGRAMWQEAQFYTRAAEEAGYRGDAAFRRRVRDRVGDTRRWQERALTVADTERFLQAQQAEAYAKVLGALARGDASALRREGLAAAPVLAGTPLADDLEDAMTLLFEWTGDRRQALEAHRVLALRHPQTQSGRAARARLDDPHYNPRARFDGELDEFHRLQRRYVFLGQRNPRRNVEFLTQLAITAVPVMTYTAGFFVTDILVRSIVVSFSNPIAPAEVIGAGKDLLDNPHNLLTPDEERDIRLTLGNLYQKMRRYDEAADTFRQARALSPALRQRLASRSADEQYRRILELPDANRQILLLERFVETSSGTAVAEKARVQLERLRTQSRVEFEIRYDWLREDPAHWRALGARVPPVLLDGGKTNGELNEHGVVFWRDVPSSATFLCTDERRKGYLNVTPRERAALRAAAQMWVDERMAREQAERALASRRVPFEVRGSAGSEGLLVYPTLRQAPLSEDDKRRFR